LPVEDFERRLAELQSQAEKKAHDAYAAGLAAGRQAAVAELEPVMGRVAKTMEELGRMKGRLRKEAESDLVKLAVEIARRILRRELNVDPEALQGVVAAALEKVQARELCRVRIHPTQEPLIRRHLTGPGITGVQIMADTSLQPGDVLFETSRGAMDVSIDSQLREIERGFVDALAG
jgi:flagellar assembly protein FliH